MTFAAPVAERRVALPPKIGAVKCAGFSWSIWGYLTPMRDSHSIRTLVAAFDKAWGPLNLIRDNDRAFGAAFRARVRAMGIRDRPTSFRSPWQNGLVERLIGSARHECTDHVIVFNEDHLRRILSNYASYYNEVRTHLSLGKDTPYTRPIERFGDIIAQPILGGLHHRYARI